MTISGWLQINTGSGPWPGSPRLQHGVTVIKRKLAKALRHFYQGVGVDEEVWLSRREFSAAGGDRDMKAMLGGVGIRRHNSGPEGTQRTQASDPQDSLSVSGDMWIVLLAQGIDLPGEAVRRQLEGPVLSGPDQEHLIMSRV